MHPGTVCFFFCVNKIFYPDSIVPMFLNGFLFVTYWPVLVLQSRSKEARVAFQRGPSHVPARARVTF